MMALALFVAVFAGVGAHNLEPHLRARDYQFVYVRSSTDTAVNASGETADNIGFNGLIWQSALNGNTAPATTTTMAQPLYPSRVIVGVYDKCRGCSGDDTVTCTSITIYGINALGKTVDEKFSTIAEWGTAGFHKYTSTQAYSRITRIVGETCTVTGTQVADSTDKIEVRMAGHLPGLPVPIKDVTDIESICRFDRVSTSWVSHQNMHCAMDREIARATITNPYKGNTINLTTIDAAGGSAAPTFELQVGDMLMMRLRTTKAYSQF